MVRVLAMGLGLLLAGCSSSAAQDVTAAPGSAAASGDSTKASGVSSGVGTAAATAAPLGSGPGPASSAVAPRPTPKVLTPGRAAKLLFGNADLSPPACGDEAPAAIRCLIEARYASDDLAKQAALRLYDETGSVAGVEVEQSFDGGWRGEIHIVPELPVGPHRRHLLWTEAAFEDFGRFFAELTQGASVPYDHEPLELLFFRSVNRTTPSAYASGWRVAYNVSGSLHGSADAVRETLFHEIFHLNDRAHDNWSESALTEIHADLLSRCSDKQRRPVTACLRPFAPSDTMVRNGTFYAFQPGNGVWEYAAELALRYYREHRLALAQKPVPKRFKCGPEPNPEAWRKLVDEFFGGIDRVPPCD
ncbi:MAG: hypothetical protein R3B72_08595 [Polyangiaceae bacterium]